MRAPDNHVLLGLYVVTIAAAMDAIVLVKGLPTGIDGNISSVILTAWNGLAAMVVNWAFGSSSQTARQTELIAAASPAVQPNVGQTAAPSEGSPK